MPLFITDGHGQYPGLVDLYGSTGGLAQYRAAMLASRAFTTLSLAYIGYQDLPQSLIVDFDYFLVRYNAAAFFIKKSFCNANLRQQ